MSLLSRIGRIPAARWVARSMLGGDGSSTSNGLAGGSTLATFIESLSSAGVTINERSALTLSAVYACQNVVSTDLASLPLTCYRRRKSGGRDVANDVAGAYLLQWSPDGSNNDDTTSYSHRQAWVAHELGWGNGLDAITFDGSGEPFRLDLLDPSKWVAERRQRDRRVYYRNLDTNDVRPAREVMHLAALGFDGLNGYSPVKLHKQGLGLGKAAETESAAFYGNGSKAGGFVKSAKKLSDDARRNLRASFEGIHRGSSRAYRVGILEEGLEWVKATVDPEDAQYLATRQFQVIEVARIYRVPPHKIGDMTQSHLANMEEANIDYVISTLRPRAVAMETVASMRLLSPRQRRQGFYFEHQLNALLRGDMKARAEFYTKLRDLGVLSPDQIADLEGFNPLENGLGNVRLVPVNMATIERVIAGTAQKGPSDAGNKPENSPKTEENPPKSGDEGSGS